MPDHSVNRTTLPQDLPHPPGPECVHEAGRSPAKEKASSLSRNLRSESVVVDGVLLPLGLLLGGSADTNAGVGRQVRQPNFVSLLQ